MTRSNSHWIQRPAANGWVSLGVAGEGAEKKTSFARSLSSTRDESVLPRSMGYAARSSSISKYRPGIAAHAVDPAGVMDVS